MLLFSPAHPTQGQPQNTPPLCAGPGGGGGASHSRPGPFPLYIVSCTALTPSCSLTPSTLFLHGECCPSPSPPAL